MPKNRLIYLGVLLVAASALLYAGYLLTKTVQFVLPITFGLGVALIVIGMVWEAKKGKRVAEGLRPGETSAESIRETKL